MTQLTQKYTIAQLLEPMSEGQEYVPSDWPLHVTLVDIFAVDDVSAVITEIENLPPRHDPITATALHDEYFGPQHQTQVTILDMSDELVALHYELIAVLKRAGAMFNNPQYIETGFRAHASVRPAARLQAGEVVTFTELAVIDMFPNQNPNRRKILKLLPLQG
jgi:hypothetical protein